MKIRFKWTNVGLRTALLTLGGLLLVMINGQTVRFVYQGY